MKVHFFMIVAGGKPDLEFQAEAFLHSLKLFGNIDYELTICKNKGDVIKSRYLKREAEIITSDNRLGLEPAWYSCLGLVPKKGDITIYTDADMLIVNDLKPIVGTCYREKSVCGVLAYNSPFKHQLYSQHDDQKKYRIKQNIWTEQDWRHLFEGCGVKFPTDKYTPLATYYKYHYQNYWSPYYVNLGFLAVPTTYVDMLNKSVSKFLVASDKLLPDHYHRPQFSMCLSIAHLNLPKIAMPIWCNCPDTNILLKALNHPTHHNKVLVLHMFKMKKYASNWKELANYANKVKLPFMKRKLQAIVKHRLGS